MGGYADISGQVKAWGPGCRANVPRALVAVTGADAVDFVQRLCSQDVKAMAPGACSPVAFMNAKGKLIVAGLALRVENGVLLEVETALGRKLSVLLEQFHFAEKLEIEHREGLQCTALMGGPEVFELAGMQVGTCTSGSTGVTCAVERHGMRWAHCHAEPGSQPPWGDAGVDWTEEQAEAFRICAGLPRMGDDADEDTLALEAGLDDHVSLSKGCYTGQEIVARIHTYGHVNRRLCLLSLDSSEDHAVGTPLVDSAGKAVGRLGSSAPVDGGRVALGYLLRDSAETGSEVRLGDPAGPVVTVRAFGGA